MGLALLLLWYQLMQTLVIWKINQGLPRMLDQSILRFSRSQTDQMFMNGSLPKINQWGWSMCFTNKWEWSLCFTTQPMLIGCFSPTNEDEACVSPIDEREDYLHQPLGVWRPCGDMWSLCGRLIWHVEVDLGVILHLSRKNGCNSCYVTRTWAFLGSLESSLNKLSTFKISSKSEFIWYLKMGLQATLLSSIRFNLDLLDLCQVSTPLAAHTLFPSYLACGVCPSSKWAHMWVRMHRMLRLGTRTCWLGCVLAPIKHEAFFIAGCDACIISSLPEKNSSLSLGGVGIVLSLAVVSYAFLATH